MPLTYLLLNTNLSLTWNHIKKILKANLKKTAMEADAAGELLGNIEGHNETLQEYMSH